MITNSKDFNKTTYLLKFTQDLEKQEDSSASLTKADLQMRIKEWTQHSYSYNKTACHNCQTYLQ